MMSLAGRVGMGNIGGVATAIAFGGPGAVFWMWASAFLGASTSFIECTLGQIYKEKDRDTGEYRGGPAYYFEKAYKHKAPGLSLFYGILFAIVTIIAMSFFLPGVQANGMASAIDNAWGIPTWVTAIGLVILLGFIVIGGVKRIAHFAVVVVPVMAIFYIIVAVVVFLMNFEDDPAGVRPDLRQRLRRPADLRRDRRPRDQVGRAARHLLQRGRAGHRPARRSRRRGLAPGQAGLRPVVLGVHRHPVRLLRDRLHHHLHRHVQHLPERGLGRRGVPGDRLAASATCRPMSNPARGFVQQGLDSVFPGFGPTFIAIALGFFVFTTIVAYYYMAEVNLNYLTRKLKNRTLARALLRILQALVLISVAYGAVNTAGAAWGLGDIGVGSMAWLNIVGILFLQVPALKALKDYRAQKKQGLDPQFDPRKLGIEGATFWELRADGLELQGKTGDDLPPEKLGIHSGKD